ncbi:MAG: archaeosortase/exosortase family protein [Candidatus Heimdallarchaeota archaeon]
MILTSWLRKLGGLILVIASIVFYLLFEKTRVVLLPPLGVVLFVGGYYLLLQEFELLERYKHVITPLAVGLILFAALLSAGLDKIILETSLARYMIYPATYIPIWILNLFGAGFHADILPTDEGTIVGVVIFPASSKTPGASVNEACSGIHSFLIFMCTFTLVMLYLGWDAPKRKLAISFFIGLAGTLTSNWVRLILVYVAGYFLGTTRMLQVHTYAGLVIFLLWMAAFWNYAINYLLPPRDTSSSDEGQEQPPKPPYERDVPTS